MIMGSAALPLLIFLPFFHIRAFLIQWIRLPQSLEQASQLILREHFSFFRMAKLKKSHNFFPSSYRPPRAFYVSITFTVLIFLLRYSMGASAEERAFLGVRRKLLLNRPVKNVDQS